MCLALRIESPWHLGYHSQVHSCFEFRRCVFFVEQQIRRLPKRVNGAIHAVGRRKSATARVYLSEGEGTLTVNGRPADVYFAPFLHVVEYLEKNLKQPFYSTGTVGKYNVMARVRGGGYTGQLEAIRLGIARALLGVTEEYRLPLRQAGLLTRDAREVERKKINRRKARKSEQYSKR
jgi:small subunit ribosomal protein S9